MSHEPPTPDQELRQMKACALDEAFLDRLESCTEGTDLKLREDEIALEGALRAARPSRLPADILSRFNSLTAGVPFAVDEKIVLFPKTGSKAPTPARRSLWKAAAAVALIGGASALFIPQSSRNSANNAAVPDPPPSSSETTTQPSTGARSKNLFPANFDRGLADARDEGVVWQAPDRPHRVVRVVYLDRVSVINNEGKTIEVEQPRVEYILVPEKID